MKGARRPQRRNCRLGGSAVRRRAGAGAVPGRGREDGSPSDAHNSAGMTHTERYSATIGPASHGNPATARRPLAFTAPPA